MTRCPLLYFSASSVLNVPQLDLCIPSSCRSFTCTAQQWKGSSFLRVCKIPQVIFFQYAKCTNNNISRQFPWLSAILSIHSLAAIGTISSNSILTPISFASNSRTIRISLMFHDGKLFRITDNSSFRPRRLERTKRATTTRELQESENPRTTGTSLREPENHDNQGTTRTKAHENQRITTSKEPQEPRQPAHTRIRANHVQEQENQNQGATRNTRARETRDMVQRKTRSARTRKQREPRHPKNHKNQRTREPREPAEYKGITNHENQKD